MTGVHDPRPLIAHVMYRFDVGGLENGVVNLINHLDPQHYRHAVIALTEVTEFKQRIRRSDVQFFSLNKPPGHALRIYPALYRLMRELRPAVVHTRNLAALEATIPAWAAGVRVRIHGEHGRDVGDFDGSNRTYQLARRLYRPFVTQYVAVSRDLTSYLTGKVGVPAARVAQIYNGVDTQRFKTAEARPTVVEGCPFNDSASWIVGHVGRMQIVKDQLTLARAFVMAVRAESLQRTRLRLVMVGEGPLRARAHAILNEAGVAHLAWLPGQRNDISSILSSFDCFVLPSRGEGISNTILEAMACGLPVIATGVGGNAELVEAGHTGELVPAGDADAMARKILDYAHHPERARSAGHAGRARVERLFGLDAMVHQYKNLYDRHVEVAAQYVRPDRSSNQTL
jgi:sugar transferase (PEP-CTERM/EpsH1 system associated)